MEPNFELFEEGERPQAASGVHVTLNKECKLFFNRLAVEALGEPDGVALLFDKRKKIIGVMPSALTKKHAYRLRPFSRGSRSKRITIKNFCRRYGLQPRCRCRKATSPAASNPGPGPKLVSGS